MKPFSVRPAMVDNANHPEVKEAVKDRKLPPFYETLGAVLGPVVRATMPNYVSPTEELGRFLTALAVGDGKELKGDGVEQGRIINNKAARRLMREGFGSR